MTGAELQAGGPPRRRSAAFAVRRLKEAIATAGPPLLYGLRLWASVCLALCVAFWLELDNPYWAGTSAAIVCQPQLGASLRKGWFRLIGATAIVSLTASFPQNRVLFLLGLALWVAGCALVRGWLRVSLLAPGDIDFPGAAPERHLPRDPVRVPPPIAFNRRAINRARGGATCSAKSSLCVAIALYSSSVSRAYVLRCMPLGRAGDVCSKLS